MSGRDNGEANEASSDSGPAHIPLRSSDADAYRLLVEELELAWARLSDTERATLDEEATRRRRANPYWPHLTSDHADRLAEKLEKNYRAIGRLESALTEPEWGLNMKVRALVSATDMLRSTSETLTVALDRVGDQLVMLNTNILRLCSALEAQSVS